MIFYREISKWHHYMGRVLLANEQNYHHLHSPPTSLLISVLFIVLPPLSQSPLWLKMKYLTTNKII